MAAKCLEIDTEILKEMRKEAGLTQGQLAEQCNVIDKTVSAWENERQGISSECFMKLCELSGRDVSEFKENVSEGATMQKIIGLDDENNELKKLIHSQQEIIESYKKRLAFYEHEYDSTPTQTFVKTKQQADKFLSIIPSYIKERLYISVTSDWLVYLAYRTSLKDEGEYSPVSESQGSKRNDRECMEMLVRDSKSDYGKWLFVQQQLQEDPDMALDILKHYNSMFYPVKVIPDWGYRSWYAGQIVKKAIEILNSYVSQGTYNAYYAHANFNIDRLYDILCQVNKSDSPVKIGDVREWVKEYSVERCINDTNHHRNAFYTTIKVPKANTFSLDNEEKLKDYEYRKGYVYNILQGDKIVDVISELFIIQDNEINISDIHIVKDEEAKKEKSFLAKIKNTLCVATGNYDLVDNECCDDCDDEEGNIEYAYLYHEIYATGLTDYGKNLMEWYERCRLSNEEGIRYTELRKEGENRWIS